MLAIFWPPVFLHCPIAPYRSTRKSGSVLFCESSATKQTFFFVSFEKEEAIKVFLKGLCPFQIQIKLSVTERPKHNNNRISISASESCENNKTTWRKAALILGSSCILLVLVFFRIQTQQVVHYPAPLAEFSRFVQEIAQQRNDHYLTLDSWGESESFHGVLTAWT